MHIIAIKILSHRHVINQHNHTILMLIIAIYTDSFSPSCYQSTQSYNSHAYHRDIYRFFLTAMLSINTIIQFSCSSSRYIQILSHRHVINQHNHTILMLIIAIYTDSFSPPCYQSTQSYNSHAHHRDIYRFFLTAMLSINTIIQFSCSSSRYVQILSHRHVINQHNHTILMLIIAIYIYIDSFSPPCYQSTQSYNSHAYHRDIYRFFLTVMLSINTIIQFSCHHRCKESFSPSCYQSMRSYNSHAYHHDIYRFFLTAMLSINTIIQFSCSLSLYIQILSHRHVINQYNHTILMLIIAIYTNSFSPSCYQSIQSYNSHAHHRDIYKFFLTVMLSINTIIQFSSSSSLYIYILSHRHVINQYNQNASPRITDITHCLVPHILVLVLATLRGFTVITGRYNKNLNKDCIETERSIAIPQTQSWYPCLVHLRWTSLSQVSLAIFLS